jgi:hypothetical protein
MFNKENTCSMFKSQSHRFVCSSPLRLGTVIILIFTAWTVSGCYFDRDVSEFYGSEFARSHLRPGEQVLFYGQWVWRPDGYVVVTDERVFYWDTHYHGRCGSQGRFVSVDHVDIKRIYRPGSKLYLVLELYARREVSVCGVHTWKQVAKTVQSQLDYINMIRNELGIIIPETVTVSELEKLNEPVIAELRKRRSNQ